MIAESNLSKKTVYISDSYCTYKYKNGRGRLVTKVPKTAILLRPTASYSIADIAEELQLKKGAKK